jgi:hypothetical protein
LAAYVSHHYDLIDVFDEPWAWKSLQDILQAYLEMIEEGKVSASSDTAKEQEAWPQTPRFFPWQYHQYTARDVEKTNKAFTRLLDAIEHQLPQTTQNPELHLPYSPAILDEANIPNNSFIRPFFSEMTPRTLNFRYIAPGISIQSPTQFAAQPWKDISDKDRAGHLMPFLLFRGDESSSLSYKRLFFPGPEESHQGTSTGLYVLAPGIGADQFGNSCRLILPFNIGGRGYARLSNGQKLQKACDVTSYELYQPGRESGFLEFHPVHLHKVLLNWAERVEAGDWEVGADGVVGGIGKFEEADTPEHWRKYQIPLSW